MRTEDFLELLCPSPPKPKSQDEAYAEFVESMIPSCNCSERHRPCDGVLAGGLCDQIQDNEHDDHVCDDPDCEHEAY